MPANVRMARLQGSPGGRSAGNAGGGRGAHPGVTVGRSAAVENPVFTSLTHGSARTMLTGNAGFLMRVPSQRVAHRRSAPTVRRGPLRARRPPLPGATVDRNHWMTRSFVAFARLLRRYHAHQAVHLGRLDAVFRRGRRVVLVGNHALDIADPLMLLAALLDRYGRVPRFIGHENGWFHLRVMRAISARYGIIPSRQPEQAAAALARDGFLMLYPGSNTEAMMRSYRDEPYRLKWENRLGFLRLALAADADVFFVAAVGSDELYYQSRLPTPEALIRLVNAGESDRYRGARLHFGLLGPHVLPGIFPFPVRVTHVVSRPLVLRDRARALRDPQALRALHRTVWQQCQAFLDAAIARRERYTNLTDRTIRAGERLLQRLGV